MGPIQYQQGVPTKVITVRTFPKASQDQDGKYLFKQDRVNNILIVDVFFFHSKIKCLVSVTADSFFALALLLIRKATPVKVSAKWDGRPTSTT